MANFGKISQQDHILNEIDKLKNDFQPVHANSRVQKFIGHTIKKLEAGIRKLEHFITYLKWKYKEQRALPKINNLVSELTSEFKEAVKVYREKAGNICS